MVGRTLVAAGCAAALALAGCHRPARRGPALASNALDASRGATAVALPGDLSPEQVRVLQRALSSAGWAVEPTGRFDEATERALLGFQASEQLPSTGNLNAETAERLGIAAGDVVPTAGGGGAGRAR